jgi:hypothetical protein
MKYIKTYESEMNKYYWLVPNDKRLVPSLKIVKSILNKEPMPNNFDKMIKIDYENEKYMCIMYIGDNIGFWSAFPYKIGVDDMFKKMNYIYGGEINFYEGEMDSIKYNL